MRIGPLNIINSKWRKRDAALPFDEWVNYFSYLGHNYQLGPQTLRGDDEPIGSDFVDLVRGAYKANGVVFACILVRLLVFSEARFQFRRLKNGTPGDLFGDVALRKLETPWPGATTGDLLTRMEQDASLAGNFFGVSTTDSIRRLRPDWTTIVLGSKMENAVWDPKAEILGYAYTPGGRNSGEDPIVYLPEEVVHYAPIPDPEASFRGMSWLQPIIDEIRADKAMTGHKVKFLAAGGTPNILVEFDKEVVKTMADFEKWVEAIKEQLGNMTAQHKALFLAGGTKGTVVGSTLEAMDFKSVQGGGETRIAAAAGVPPQIVGLSEGLQGSSLNQGNYAAARRRLADGTMRPLWRNAAGSLQRVISMPPASADGAVELWYDERGVAFLREDRADVAKIRVDEAMVIRQLVDGGFEPASVIAAVENEDWKRLTHTGLTSVQLVPPNPNAPTNGQGQPDAVPAPAP